MAFEILDGCCPRPLAPAPPPSWAREVVGVISIWPSAFTAALVRVGSGCTGVVSSEGTPMVPFGTLRDLLVR